MRDSDKPTVPWDGIVLDEELEILERMRKRQWDVLHPDTTPVEEQEADKDVTISKPTVDDNGDAPIAIDLHDRTLCSLACPYLFPESKLLYQCDHPEFARDRYLEHKNRRPQRCGLCVNKFGK